MLDMRMYDYYFRKRLGYFGFRYMRYLEEYYPKAYDKLCSTSQAVKVFETVNSNCQINMETLMLMLKQRKKYMNPHHMNSELAKTIYYMMVDKAKDKVFEEALELLQYATWMV